ncbi:HAD-like domain-containing protein [Apiospora saccharicola]|uniref:HAD-like domain-containing protein n=1 Tax=Apiospora saccharicola TaxID=335842 RepID=A0ABR1WJ50_9PEZI
MSIFLDFDGTITVQDTIGEVANFALRVRADEGQDLARAWDGVVRSYLDDYRGHVEGYRVEEARRRGVDDEVAFLRDMKSVELQSLVRIHECGVFRDIAPERFYEAGRRAVEVDGTVKLRPGFREFVQARVAEGWRLWVVSVNWSAAFIAGALGCPEVTVIANTVRSDGSISGPGILNQQNGAGEQHRNLTNSCDKLAVVEAILKQQAEEFSLQQGKPSLYFGDSITDLECLLRADRGVVISDKEDSTLLQTLGRIGKQVSHSTDAGAQDSSSRLSWASNYHEVEKHVAFTL